MRYFGKTGANQRPRIRKYHAELLYTKFITRQQVLSIVELDRPKEYVDRLVRYSKGMIEYVDEEKGEMILTDKFTEQMEIWFSQYKQGLDLEEKDEDLSKQGVILEPEGSIRFDGKLTYSRFFRIVSDDSENMNDPRLWRFSKIDIPTYDNINFADKGNPIFSSELIILKFYVLRKIDEVAFVTSRYVHCPVCGVFYSVPASKIDFMSSYKCENLVNEKICGTTLRKFPARKMIPTYIYDIAVEIKGEEAGEYKEFFMESFQELAPGFYTGMVFGRAEMKSNSFYFTCLKAHKEKSKVSFSIKRYEKNDGEHNFFNLVDSVVEYIQQVGFVIDPEKARLPVLIETMKRLALGINKEINLDHSLYFGAPGIGKTFALTLLHHCFYANAGFISGPRFTLAGLTGGQREVFYQDSAKKRNVPGLFSQQAFLFDEINNDTFLADDKAINLVKSAALLPSGNAATVGGKEFIRISLIAGTANYDMDHLRHYENKVRKFYTMKTKEIKSTQTEIQESLLEIENSQDKEVPDDLDFYCNIKEYGIGISKELKASVLKARDDGNHFMTNFPKALMERFYWTVLVHPKYDKKYLKKKTINVEGYISSRHSIYNQRELLTQLYISDLDDVITKATEVYLKEFNAQKENEKQWSNDVKNFLALLANKYPEFFSMFNRISQVHVFALFALTLINKEIKLSFQTKRLYERLVSLLHTPIELPDFDSPDFENFTYIGESRVELSNWIKEHPEEDIRNYVDYDKRKLVRVNLVELENGGKIKKVAEYKYVFSTESTFEEVQNDTN